MATVDPPGRLTRWVIAPLLIGMAIVVGVIGLHGARDATAIGYQAVVRHSQDPAEVARAARYQSIMDQVRTKLPAHATVFVPETADLTDTVTVEWEQRLPEIALMEGHTVVSDPAQADYWLRVTQTASSVVLVASRRR